MEMTEQAGVEVHYTIDPDPAVWVCVPLAFPWNGFDTEDQWARELSHELLAGLGAPEAVRAGLEQSALAMVRIESPWSAPAERFWRLAAGGGPERLVHLYLAETDASTADEAVYFAYGASEGALQTARVILDTAFDIAVETLVIEPLEEGSCAVLRLVGLFRGVAFTLELVETDSAALPELQRDLLALFASIRVGEMDVNGAVLL